MHDLIDIGRVVRFRMLIRPVASLERSIDFYCNALGFEHLQTRRKDDVDKALIVAAYGSDSLPTARLRAGRQELALVEFAAADLPEAPDAGATDPHFQHMAVIVRDMSQSFARLRAFAPDAPLLTEGGPQLLPLSSGGVTAIKLRDPDGHPVELMSYRRGGMPKHWQDVEYRVPDALTLGIDHTAIGVSNTAASIRFWCDVLGLTLSSQQVNRGVEQERLDGVQGAVVDVVGLSPEQATPHIELLGYQRRFGFAGAVASEPSGGAQGAAGLRGFTVLEVDHLAALVRRWVETMQHLVAPRSLHTDAVALAHDPDGHALLLWQPDRT